ncbi:MAG: PAS domain S-box protein, partial [Rhodospirillaceae bacterium]|nr:PAS domain S-box protein [Rhodospirillaceae bacterium]
MSSLQTPPSPTEGAQLLALAAAHSPVILYAAATDDDFAPTYISENLESLTGHSVDRMLSRDGYRDRQIHPDDLSGYRQSCSSLGPGDRTKCSYRLRSLDGDYRWYRDDIHRVEEPAVLTGCMTDINAEIMAEAAQQEQQQAYQEAVELIDGGFCVFNSDDNVVACNTMMAKATGHDPEHFIGKSRKFLAAEFLTKIEIFDGEPTEQTPAWAERIFDRISDPSGMGAELKMHAGYWVRATFAPTSEGGRVILITNIHGQKKLEQESRESAAQFRMLVESHPLPVILVDMESGRMLYESPAASAMLGREWDPDINFKAKDMYADSTDRAQFVTELQRTGQLHNKLMPFKRADGTLFRVVVDANLIMHQGREVSIASITDLTAEQDRELDLTRANETMEDAIESLSEGFALYDRDDRMVACNSRYVDYNWPCKDLIKPGMHWEDLVRVGASRDTYFDSDDEMEAFIEQHKAVRLQGKPMLNYGYTQNDGRCFQCSKRPTRQGGMVVTLSEISERTELERELRESAEHFRMLVESHPLPVILVDVETGRVLYESPAASTLFGRQWRPDFDFKVQDMYADPDDRGQFLAELRRTGELRNRPIHYKRADGSAYWISCNSKLIMHEGREVHITSILDLTEQQERASATARANETLEDAIESLSEGFALYDGDDRLVLFNSRFLEFNQICADIIKPGLAFDDLIRVGTERGQFYGEKSEIEAFLRDHLADRTSGLARLGFEYRLADGTWYQFSSQPTRQGGTVVTIIDMSSRKDMERALRDSEASVRQILESCPAPITVSRGHDSIILYESPASKQLFKRGQEGSNMVARDYWADKSDRDNVWAELQETGLVQDRPIQFIDGEGKAFWGSYSGRMVENQGEKIMISAILDLTEYRSLEQEMVRQREALHVSEKMVAMGELLASVSHELNNPLSVVVGQALLLQETATDPAVTARAERIVSSA